MEEVRQLRHLTNGTHRAGRRHAFLAMLHLNATLALEIYPRPWLGTAAPARTLARA